MKLGTSNIQHRTTNIQWLRAECARLGRGDVKPPNAFASIQWHATLDVAAPEDGRTPVQGFKARNWFRRKLSLNRSAEHWLGALDTATGEPSGCSALRFCGRKLSAVLLMAVVSLGVLTGGCAGKSKARLREQNAYLAGQNAALQQQQALGQAQTPGVTIVGHVQHPYVPWVSGLTLAQAIATANYVGSSRPTQIIITRNGESAVMDANVLINGTNIALEIGDVIELR